MKGWMTKTLGMVAQMANTKVAINKLTVKSYISTENMLPDRGGIEVASKMPPSGNANAFLSGDVLFSNIRTYFKKVWLAQWPGGASADVIIFRPKNVEEINSQFLYYLLSSDAFIDSTVTASKGTKMPRGDKDAMQRYAFLLPPLPTQKRIAGIVSAYDELIENSQRRITILESMARSLYREWFVHFRFPGHENYPRVASALGEIPQGWEVMRLGDIVDISWGDTSTTKASYVPDGYPAFSASGMDGKLDHYDYDRVGIVLSAIGAQCGKTWLARGKWSCIKNTIRFWANSSKASTEFLFIATFGQDFWPRRGAAQPFISQGDGQRIELLIPDARTMNGFTEFVSKIFVQITILEEQTNNLRNTRDLLFPRLLSGQIDVETIQYA